MAGVSAVIAAMPLAWVAPIFIPSEVGALAPDMDFRGTVWNGHVTNIPVFGEGKFDVEPLNRNANVQAGNGRHYFSGELGLSSAQDIKLHLDLIDIPFSDSRLQGLQGVISVSIDDVELGVEGCLKANGTASTDLLQRNGGAIQWTGPELSGPISCDKGSLIADLLGDDAQQSISARIRLSPEGAYRADISVQTARAEADAVLPVFGFSRDGRDFKLTEQGRWR